MFYFEIKCTKYKNLVNPYNSKFVCQDCSQAYISKRSTLIQVLPVL